MRNGIYYLNEAKTKWMIFKDGKKEKVKLINGDSEFERTILHYELINNKEYFTISWNGMLCTLPAGIRDITLLVK